MPLNRYFDYLCPPGYPSNRLLPGMRLKVPFGRGKTIGVLLETTRTSELPLSRLKRALAVIDNEPVFDEVLMKLLRWSADYFHHAPGEVFATALPALLRGSRPLPSAPEHWRATGLGQAAEPLKGASRQQALLELLREHESLSESELPVLFKGWRSSMRALHKKGLVERRVIERGPPMPGRGAPLSGAGGGTTQRRVPPAGIAGAAA